MQKPFTVSSTNKLTAQPSTGGKFYYRSDQAVDTGNLSVTGLVAAVSTTDTAALNGQKEVQTADSFTSITAALLSASQIGNVSVFQQGVAGQGSIQVNTLPANNDTLKVGVIGFERTYTFKTTLTGAANEIHIAASINAQATNIYEAINAGANAGTDYGTGTAAHADLAASAPSGSALVITDKIACNRQLGWTNTQTTGATLSLVAPIGGTDGTLLAYLAIGITQVFNSLTLSTENLGSPTLPAKVAPTTDPLIINGKECTIRLRAPAVSSGIAVKYQTSTDGTNWIDGAVSITNLNNNTQFIKPTEQNVERLRLAFTANANTSDSNIDARVIFPLV